MKTSRGVGGRVATRRTDSGAAFDHGAQYFTASDLTFSEQVRQWCARGSAALWRGRVVALNQGSVTESERHDRYVGQPGMNAIATSLASNMDVRTGTSIRSITRVDERWLLMDSAGNHHGPYDIFICTAPPVQTQALLGDSWSAALGPLQTVVMDPCWAVMLQFNEPLNLAYDAAFVGDSPLSWIARNSSKPGRDVSERWILHASTIWSQENLELPPDVVAEQLLDSIWHSTRHPPRPTSEVVANRWRYARPREPLGQRYLLDCNLQLGACGDWCAGPRVEGAYLSGLALAEALVYERRNGNAV